MSQRGGGAAPRVAGIRRIGIAALAWLGTGLAVAPPAVAQQTFTYTGAQQTYTVPDGVTRLHVVAIGGRGSNNEGISGGSPSRAGGLAARVEGEIDVTPGAVLTVVVGGNGTTSAGGFNGGGFSTPIVNGLFAAQPGGGGGASDVRLLSCATTCPGTADSLASRLIVAGGGGGAGANANDSGTVYAGRTGGRGGRAGSEGEGSGTTSGGGGGERGWPDRGGRGGNWDEGGAHVGGNGALGQGGTGGQGAFGGGGAGGGGGGGRYGGGGGAGSRSATDVGPIGGGGGGGGSSLVPAGGTITYPNPAEAPSVTISVVGDPPPDVDPPDTTITTGPAEGETITAAQPAFTFSSSEENSTFECRLDAGDFTSCESGITLGPLGNGPHTFAVRATDPAGNTDPTPDTRTFTVDVDTGPSPDPYAEVVAGDGPVGYWRFGELRGPTAFDATPNANDGTYLGDPQLQRPGALVGDDDTAVRLDGVDDLVQVPDSASLDVGSSFSAEGWVRRSDDTRTHQLMLKGARGLQVLVMNAGAGSEIWLRKAGVTTIARSSAGVPADGAHHHVAVTMDGAGTARIHLDGTDVTVPVAGQHLQVVESTATPLYFGSKGTSAMEIDEFALYDEALTAEQVQAHHDAATP